MIRDINILNKLSKRMINSPLPPPQKKKKKRKKKKEKIVCIGKIVANLSFVHIAVLKKMCVVDCYAVEKGLCLFKLGLKSSKSGE